MMLIHSLIFIALLILIPDGILLVCFGSKKRKDGSFNKPMLISGWVVIGATIVATIASIVFNYLFGDSDITVGTYLLTFTMPFVIIVGFIAAIALGITNLVKGYEKSEDGSRNNGKIISGWALLIIGIVLVLALAITISFVFNQQSGKSEPVRFM